MATSAITSSVPPVQNAANQLRMEDLLKVLLTELTHQNPLKPVDNKDFMAQIAQFASLESSQQLNDSIGQLLSLDAITQSASLLNRKVSANVNGTTVSGTVSAVRMSDGVPKMTIKQGDGTVVADVTLGQLLTIEPTT